MVPRIEVGKLYFISHKYPNTYTKIIKFEDNTPNNWSPQTILGSLITKDLFIILDTQEINPYEYSYDDSEKIWLRILFKDTVGWIKADKHELYEMNPTFFSESVYILDH